VEKFADNTSAVDVAFHPNGKLIASAAADCTIRLWGVPKQP
jgi:WD40 repeat protein